MWFPPLWLGKPCIWGWPIRRASRVFLPEISILSLPFIYALFAQIQSVLAGGEIHVLGFG